MKWFRRLVFFFIVVLLVLWVLLYWQAIVEHASQETGTSNEGSRAYAYWSGFGSVFPWSLAILGGIIAFYRTHECHNTTCHWPAHHTTANGHRLCKKCIGKPADELELHPIDPDHQ